MDMLELVVPDIGDFDAVEVIELLVEPGAHIEVDQALITVESDKASMEIPSSHAGIVRELKVRLGDKVARGSVLALLQASQSGAAATAPDADAAAQLAPAPVASAQAAAAPSAAPANVHAYAHAHAHAHAHAASANAPAVVAATPAAVAASVAPGQGGSPAPDTLPGAVSGAVPGVVHDAVPASAQPIASTAHAAFHASPSVRKYARELGVELAGVGGTGPSGRIQRQDVQTYVKAALSGARASTPSGTGLQVLPWPSLDFSRFGQTSLQPLSRIQKISGPSLHRNWVMIPHVTQYDEADVTDLEALRRQLNAEAGKDGARVTLLAFAIKACVAALKRFPAFNASLDEGGEHLILKHYYHIGFAADTPQGLVVPVVRDADRKSITEIAQETATLSGLARSGKLKPSDMQGASFTVSSLGGIGGSFFTPIINAPEVAILGLARTVTKPVWDGSQFVPRLMLPMALSYDHRAIDGALGARFSVYLSSALADLRRTLL